MRRVLSVGQCGVDHRAISRYLRSTFDAHVEAVHDGDEALERLRSDTYELVLVNRVLDRDGGDGLDVVRRVKADPRFGGVPVMLVSNFPDWQERAVALGALAGFGKGELYSPSVDSRLGPVLGPSNENTSSEV